MYINPRSGKLGTVNNDDDDEGDDTHNFKFKVFCVYCCIWNKMLML